MMDTDSCETKEERHMVDRYRERPDWNMSNIKTVMPESITDTHQR